MTTTALIPAPDKSVFGKTFRPRSAHNPIFRLHHVPIAPRTWPAVTLPTDIARALPSLKNQKPRRLTPNAVC